MIMNGESVRIWKEVIVAYFKASTYIQTFAWRN